MYSTSEAAEKLGLSQDHVRLLARTGVIEAKKLGHDWIVLNLDYKRKRRLKRTGYVSLTPSGRQAITTLVPQGRDDEARILRFLISGGATVQQISDETYIQSSKIRLYLRQFKKESWIKERRVEGETLKEESQEEDNPEEETPKEERPKGILLVYDF